MRLTIPNSNGGSAKEPARLGVNSWALSVYGGALGAVAPSSSSPSGFLGQQQVVRPAGLWDSCAVRIREFLQVMRKFWWVIALSVVIAGGLAAVVSYRATPSFTAKSSVFVSIPTGNTPGELSQGSTYAQNLMQSFADLATRPVVLNPVIEDLDLDATPASLARQIDARVTDETVILEIWANDTSPKRAAAIANSVVKELGTAVSEVSPKRDDGEPTIEMTALGNATAPEYPSSPNKRRNIAAGLLAGLLLGVALAVAAVKLDTRVRRPDDVTSKSPAPILAELWDDADLHRGVVAMRDKPLGATAESFRRLRANLEFLRVGGKPIAIVVTSAIAGEGKTSTTLNLAVACAQGGDRVLLIDADLRKPAVASRLGVDDVHGLSTLLTGRVSFPDSIRAGGRGLGIDVVTSGPVPPNPADLLGSQAMRDFLAFSLSTYDVVLIDTPPVLPVVDAAVLSRQVDGAVLVVRLNRAKKENVVKAFDSLGQVGVKMLGVVLNGARRSEASGYYRYEAAKPASGKSESSARRSPASAV